MGGLHVAAMAAEWARQEPRAGLPVSLGEGEGDGETMAPAICVAGSV